MFAAYVKKYPKNKPKFTVMANEANALAKMQQGVSRTSSARTSAGSKYFAESGFVQPWDPKLIPNLKHLNPDMVKAGQYKGKQYGIPEDWGFDAILYRTDKVKPKARSWSLLFDERYKGKIAWWDDIAMLVDAGVYLGIKNPWNQTDAELKQTQKFLISKKHVVRMFWSSETDMQEAFGNGDIWIAYAWPADWAPMKEKGLPVVYMHPKEGPSPGSACSCSARDRRARSSRTRTSTPGAREERQVARGQLRLRALQPRPAVVERPAEGAASSPTRTR